MSYCPRLITIALQAIAVCLVVTAALAGTTEKAMASGPGWCTVKGAGVEDCSSNNPFDACKIQHSHYAPTQTFYGFVGWGTNWYQKLCRWHTGIGIINPTIVEFKCPTGYTRLPWNTCIQFDYPCWECWWSNGANPFPKTQFPINILTGSKSFTDTDFETADHALSLKRSFVTVRNGGTPTRLADMPLGLANWVFDSNTNCRSGPTGTRFAS